MKIFVISLLSDRARREAAAGRLVKLGLDFEFFDAVAGAEKYGDVSWYDPAAAKRLEDRDLRPGEVGCALSHAAVYAEIDRRGLPWALVLEDDAIPHAALPAVLAALEGGMLEQGDLVFLERCDHYLPWTARPVAEGFRIASPALTRHGSNAQSAGYIVTRDAAAAMKLVNVPVKFPADNWGYYAGLVRFRGIVPSLTLIRQDLSFGSTITADGSRREFTRYSIKDLLWNSFKVYSPLGRALKKAAKRLLRGEGRR